MRNFLYTVAICILVVQYNSFEQFSSRKTASLIDSAENELKTYRDKEAWELASDAEKMARKSDNCFPVCWALLVKGSVCDYADKSADENRNDEAIALCKEVISFTDEDDYLRLQQIYDQLTVLYKLVGDNDSSMDAHTKYVTNMQKQMSQVKESAPLSVNDLPSRGPEIVNLVSDGKSTADIAKMLNISHRTASNHKQNIYNKFCLNSIVELRDMFKDFSWDSIKSDNK